MKHFLCCLPLLILLSMADAAILHKQDRLPRDFAYTIGDLVTRNITLEIERPHELSRDKIPAVGKINRWLELRSAEIDVKYHTQYTAYRLTLEYQIINSEVNQSTIFLPGFELDLEIPERHLPLIFQSLPVRMTRVTREDSSRTLQVLDLQAVIAPEPVPVFLNWVKLLLSLVAVVFSVLMMIYITVGLPWGQHRQGPFTKACKHIHRLHSEGDVENQQAGLRYLHEAFNETWGSVLFHDDLPDFLQAHPSFKQVSAELSDLFAASRTIFFQNTKNADITLKTIKHLCLRCRDIERGLR